VDGLREYLESGEMQQWELRHGQYVRTDGEGDPDLEGGCVALIEDGIEH
jgi:hypothetical protein